MARLAKRKGLLLALILAPWWINYITRMMGWISILDKQGPLNHFLERIGLVDSTNPINWLGGNPGVVVLGLVYGYLPFFIVPLYASLDRIDQRLLEASRDLGEGRGAHVLADHAPAVAHGPDHRDGHHGTADGW